MYKIGELAKLFGVTPDTIRYYEQEGLLIPGRNPENGYREYSYSDVFFLSDILFYRDVNMSIEEIKAMTADIDAEEEFTAIKKKQELVRSKLEYYRLLDRKLKNWEKLHQEAMDYVGKFERRSMPRAFRKKTFADTEDIKIEDLYDSIPFSRDNAFFLTKSFSFRSDGRDQRGRISDMRYYFVLDGEVAEGLDFSPAEEDYVVEEHPDCLFTVMKYNEDISSMTADIFKKSREEHIILTGDIFARQSITAYISGKCLEYYRIYAPVEK